MQKPTNHRVSNVKAAIARFCSDTTGTAALVNFTPPMTIGLFDRRARANSIDLHAAHSPPPFPPQSLPSIRRHEGEILSL